MSAKRTSTKRVRRWAVTAAATLCAAATMAAELAPRMTQDEFLDFNDNQIPSGWSLVVSKGGDRCGVAQGRFFAGQFDNACSLESPLAILPSTKNLTIKWQGNVFHTLEGNYQSVELVTTPEQRFYVSIGSHDMQYIQIALSSGDGAIVSIRSLPSGNYDFTLQFTEKKLVFAGKLNGSTAFKQDIELHDFRFDSVQKIKLSNSESTGQDLWMDNVSIRQFTCKHPVHQSCD